MNVPESSEDHGRYGGKSKIQEYQESLIVRLANVSGGANVLDIAVIRYMQKHN